MAIWAIRHYDSAIRGWDFGVLWDRFTGEDGELSRQTFLRQR